MLIDGTPEETTFPRPRLSAQSQAKLLSPAPACKWAPSQMNASEPRAMLCHAQGPSYGVPKLPLIALKVHGHKDSCRASSVDARLPPPLTLGGGYRRVIGLAVNPSTWWDGNCLWVGARRRCTGLST